MNKKLVTALVLALVVSLVAAPAVMAEETDKKTDQKQEEVKKEKDEEEKTYTMDELVVIASKHPEKLSEASVSVEKIDEEDIEQKNAHNVADLLRGASSVNISDYGGHGGSKTINIRGSNAKRVLILVDGQRINDPQTGGVDLSQLPIKQIKKIEILKGPSSSLYGANALGGVVNITTKSGSEKSKTDVEVNFGSFETRKLNLNHSGSTESLKYILSALKKKSDGYRMNSAMDQERIFTKFSHKLDEYSNLMLSLKCNDFYRRSPGDVETPDPNHYQKDEDKNINVQLKKQFKNADTKITVYYNKHETDNYNKYYKNSTNPMDFNRYYYDDGNAYYYDEGEKIQVSGISLDEKVSDSDHERGKLGLNFSRTHYYQAHTLTYGGEFYQKEFETVQTGPSITGKYTTEHDQKNKAFFVQDEWQVKDKLKINFGGRYDDNEKFGSEFSPRLGAVYTINSNLNFHASAGEAYKVPTFDDLYWPSTPMGEGNPNLEPETAKAYEMGLRYLNKGLKGEFNLFKKDIDNYIQWAPEDPTAQYSVWKPSNFTSVEITGGELILNKKLTSNYSVKFNYTYLDSNNEKYDKRLSYKPYHMANIGLNYNNQDISFGLNGKYVGDRISADATYASVVKVPGYFVTNLKLSKKLKDNAKISLEINNLFDREYESKKDFLMPGRNVMLNLSREF